MRLMMCKEKEKTQVTKLRNFLSSLREREGNNFLIVDEWFAFVCFIFSPFISYSEWTQNDSSSSSLIVLDSKIDAGYLCSLTSVLGWKTNWFDRNQFRKIIIVFRCDSFLMSCHGRIHSFVRVKISCMYQTWSWRSFFSSGFSSAAASGAVATIVVNRVVSRTTSWSTRCPACDIAIATGWHVIITGIRVIGAAIGRSTTRTVAAGNLFVKRRRCPVLVGSEESKPTTVDRVPLCGTSFRIIVSSVSWYIQVPFGSVAIGWWGAFGWRRVTMSGQFFVAVGVILIWFHATILEAGDQLEDKVRDQCHEGDDIAREWVLH